MIDWHDIVGITRFNRTFEYAQRAGDALVRFDDEHVRLFLKAIDWTHIKAIGVLAFDASFCKDVSHASISRHDIR
jgi:hypothetical protein